jgi:N-acetylmuramoyl-L-alanine amidase
MRTLLVIAALGGVLASAVACSSVEGRPTREAAADAVRAPDAPAVAANPLPQPAPVRTVPVARASGPMDAATLARELGMKAETAGPGLLLSNSDLRARVFPGSDRLVVNGDSIPMGGAVRREGPSFVLPPGGVDALRGAVADASRRRASMARMPALKMVEVVAFTPPPPSPVVLPPSPVAAARPMAGGDPSWAPAVAERRWRWIVVHHSDDHEGACAKYDRVHRGQGWENGCGYHFVIGNGSQSADGEVETGPRWDRQLQGAHAKTPDNRYNDHGIGIVLVGDFERGGRPTAKQYDALVRLTRWAMARYGIAPGDVLRHSDCKSTACPGKNFPWARYQADLAK